MTTEPETLVTPEMEQRKNKWSEPRVSPPIALSDIRKWAIAVYWPETPPRLYWDEEYAKTTHWGGIIAPQEFNPFAWPVRRENVPSLQLGPTPGGVGTRGMNGGQVVEYHFPMRPGDVISSSNALVEWHERRTRLGLTLFSISENRWTNQKGELVKVGKSTGIRY